MVDTVGFVVVHRTCVVYVFPLDVIVVLVDEGLCSVHGTCVT